MNEENPSPGTPAEISRRRFLERLSIGLSAVIGAVLSVPLVGFILAPLFRRAPDLWRSVGRVDSFEIGKTVLLTLKDISPLPWAGVTANTGAWLRRNSETEFIVFAVNCTHLGCPVRWMPDAELFLCPCHGGVYYKDGSVAAGPPPRPLTRYEVRVRDHHVELLSRPLPVG